MRRVLWLGLAVWGGFSIITSLYWAHGESITEFNPREIAVPAMPPECREWEAFVLARRLADGRAEYRCGPGVGYVRFWPFVSQWSAPRIE